MTVECVEMRNNMAIHAFRFVALLFVFLSFSCSLHKTQALHQQPHQLPDTQPPMVAEENQQPAEIALIDVPADAAPKENGEIASNLDGVNGGIPAPDDSRGVLPVFSLPEEPNENEVMAPVEDVDT
jgi:hypothetical protein